MKPHYILPAIAAASSFVGCGTTAEPQQKKPNLLIIQTDEQSLRTLGCYRDLIPESQAYTWGREAFVETPNIDRIANEGMICTNYYASSPVSTPSRASFQTGLYPVATGAPINGMTMNPNLISYAEMLRREGYQTDYVGKWHLAGTPHVDKLYIRPGFDFGYMDRSYVFETNHNKWYEIVGKPNDIKTSNKPAKVVDPAMYSTDFLVNRSIEMMKRDMDKPFCMMLSIPDPHSPNIGREPYTSIFKNMKIERPQSMEEPAVSERPKWAIGGKNESQKFDPDQVREYFAMVKCIDDNIGRVLDFLDENGLADNTIVVFTSDHGDMMYEHHKMDKGVPYDAAMRIPFAIRYPGKIKSGSINKTCYTTCDFVPTILGLMGAEQVPYEVHGIDDSASFLSNKDVVESDRIIYTTDSPFNVWTAALDGRYKLVLSCRERPWLFDMESDPSESINFYNEPEYKGIVEKLQPELLRQMEKYQDPSIDLGHKFLMSNDDTTDYVSPYEGKSLKEIVKLEPQVLGEAIHAIHEQCFNK